MMRLSENTVAICVGVLDSKLSGWGNVWNPDKAQSKMIEGKFTDSNRIWQLKVKTIRVGISRHCRIQGWKKKLWVSSVRGEQGYLGRLQSSLCPLVLPKVGSKCGFAEERSLLGRDWSNQCHHQSMTVLICWHKGDSTKGYSVKASMSRSTDLFLTFFLSPKCDWKKIYNLMKPCWDSFQPDK